MVIFLGIDSAGPFKLLWQKTQVDKQANEYINILLLLLLLFNNTILKEEIASKYRLCKQHEETIDHLTSECPILAKNEYLMRHDKVFTQFHYSICKALGTETTDKWYTHMPKPVYEEGDVTVLWNQAVHTEKLQQIGQI